VSLSNAKSLLLQAASEADRPTRHLLVAAALRLVLERDPIVVGGTAEEYWTAAPYHETDLDLCAPIFPQDEVRLAKLGFEREGRHWIWGREGRWVAVEFPDAQIDGDEQRTREVRAGTGVARVIGLDDLYLDRLRQATIDEHSEGVEYHSALAVVAARFDDLDWTYVGARIAEITLQEQRVGQSMRRMDRRLRRRVRRALSQPDPTSGPS
jgi:hypothetical protein